MGAYSRWALIRGWALIRINTVATTREKLVDLLSQMQLCNDLHHASVFSRDAEYANEEVESATMRKMFGTNSLPS